MRWRVLATAALVVAMIVVASGPALAVETEEDLSGSVTGPVEPGRPGAPEAPPSESSSPQPADPESSPESGPPPGPGEGTESPAQPPVETAPDGGLVGPGSSEPGTATVPDPPPTPTPALTTPGSTPVPAVVLQPPRYPGGTAETRDLTPLVIAGAAMFLAFVLVMVGALVAHGRRTRRARPLALAER